MRFIFLGTGGYHPNERRHTSGVLAPEIGLQFDAGTGSFRIADRLERDELTIALSHAHLDHICGLTYLLVPLHDGRLRRLRVLADEVVLQALREHLFATPIFPIVPRAEFVTLEEGAPVDLGNGASLSHVPLAGHPGRSRGFRLDWTDASSDRPRSLAFITDTSVDGSYTEFIRGVDVLIHECYFPDDRADWAAKTGHSHASAVAHLAREAAVGRLVLTHIDPQQTGDDPIGLGAVRAIFPHTAIAEDLMEIKVP